MKKVIKRTVKKENKKQDRIVTILLEVGSLYERAPRSALNKTKVEEMAELILKVCQ